MSGTNTGCIRSGSFCSSHSAKWPQGATMCKKAARFAICLVSGERMAPGAAHTLHPLLALAMKRGEMPKVQRYSISAFPTVLEISRKAKKGEIVQISEQVAKQLSAGINPGSKLQGMALLDGTNIKVFIPEREAEELEKKREERIRHLATGIVHSQDHVFFSNRKEEGGVVLTQCIVARNCPKGICQCGAWHDWTTMPAVSRGAVQHFGFGPACGAVARKSVRIDGMLSTLVLGEPADTKSAKTRKGTGNRPLRVASRRFGGTPDHRRQELEFVAPVSHKPKKGSASRRMSKEEAEARKAKKAAAKNGINTNEPKGKAKNGGKPSKKDRKAQAMAAK